MIQMAHACMYVLLLQTPQLSDDVYCLSHVSLFASHRVASVLPSCSVVVIIAVGGMSVGRPEAVHLHN